MSAAQVNIIVIGMLSASTPREVIIAHARKVTPVTGLPVNVSTQNVTNDEENEI